MKNPIIIEFIDKKGKVISMNYYLSAQDFINENENKDMNVIMYITHRITPKMRLKYSDIQKDNKFYFIKNDQLLLIRI
jgi:hypothetical protein